MIAVIKIEPKDVPILSENGKQVMDYEIDLRTVVVQRQRIVRARPRIDKWKLKFKIIYDPTELHLDMLETIISEAGRRVGLLDYRPQKSGDCGTFDLVKS